MLASLLTMALLQMAVPFVSVFVTIRPSLVRGLVATFLWIVCQVPLGFVFAFFVLPLFVKGFIIPTGAMAETLRGDHHQVICPRCGHVFAVNAAMERDPNMPALVTGCTCPNCRLHLRQLTGNALTKFVEGDRILAEKRLLAGMPGRFEIITYLFPEGVQAGKSIIYVSRRIGLPGEVLAIHGGDLYRLPAEDTPARDERGIPAEELRLPQHMHQEAPQLLELFRQGKFQPLRRPPAVLDAMKKLVYDNDQPARDLQGVLPPRWAAAAGSGWTAVAEGKTFAFPAKGGEIDWLTYQHILRPADWPDEDDRAYPQRVAEIKNRAHKPQLITDFSAYNSHETLPPQHEPPPTNWVGDLLLDLELQVAEARGEVWLELARGVDRFQARCNLETGACALVRLQKGTKKALANMPTSLNRPGSHRLRFANCDQRLTVWVDEGLPFQEGVPYERPWHWDAKEAKWVDMGPTANDLQPVRIGARGAAVEVRRLKLWRDTYYVTRPGGDPADGLPRPELPGDINGPVQVATWRAQFWANFWSDPKEWAPVQQPPVLILYTPTGHSLVLGDNSPESYDSRAWGTVPDELVQGRAALLYFPLERMRLLR
jgi:signal peptidase I